jgi:NADH:ubiquinone oxidoreductase subunit 5 (subunit L)/multisubunit Na+/H+ antiporter MnhA subunit
MNALLWLLVSLPLGAGALFAVAGRRADRFAPVAGVAVAALVLADAALVAAGRPSVSAPFLDGIPAGLAVDGLSAILVLTVAAVTLAVLVFSTGEPAGVRSGRFFGLMLLFEGAMLLTVTATGLALLLMGWEAMGAASYSLIGFWWREPRRVQAANTAFLVTRAADLGLYLAAGAVLAGGVGTLALARLSQASSPWLSVVTVGVILAALGKSAQLPFSFWLSRAMEGPSPVSALLHSATMVAAGGYLLLRLQPLLHASGFGETTVAWAGVLTALLLGLVAVAQRDLKQLLAASTCSQIGFVVLAAGSAGIAGGVDQLVAHAAAKSLLFLCAGAWLTALGTRDLQALRGAARRYRSVGVLFAVGALALAGIPPLSLWVSKDGVLAAALHRSPALYAVGLAAAAVSALYSLRALSLVFARSPLDAEAGYDSEQPGTRRVSAASLPPLVVLAAGAALLGLLALPPITDAIERTLGASGEPRPAWWELVLSGGIAVIAGAAAWGRELPLPTLFARWLELERAAHVLVVRPTLALARTLAAFDDRVLDRGVELIPVAGRRAARLAALELEWPLDGLVGGVARGTRRLGVLARRPQTGQLHQYYAQAAALLALLALVFALAR